MLSTYMPRLFVTLVNANEHLIRANVITRVKGAIARAFSVPTLAAVVA